MKKGSLAFLTLTLLFGVGFILNVSPKQAMCVPDCFHTCGALNAREIQIRGILDIQQAQLDNVLFELRGAERDVDTHCHGVVKNKELCQSAKDHVKVLTAEKNKIEEFMKPNEKALEQNLADQAKCGCA